MATKLPSYWNSSEITDWFIILLTWNCIFWRHFWALVQLILHLNLYKYIYLCFFLRNVFLHLVSTETFFFFSNFGNCRKFTYVVATDFNFLPDKLNFFWGNYSRKATIQGQKLHEEIRYLNKLMLKEKNHFLEWLTIYPKLSWDYAKVSV